MKKNIIIIAIICLASISQAKAQSLSRQVIGSAGMAVQNSTAGLSFTVGEVVTASAINSSVHLTQGFQQAEPEDFVGIVQLDNTSVKAVVFPNPTIKELKINSDLAKEGINTLSYQILDLTGKLVLQGTINSNNSKINVDNLAAAAYMLKLSSSNGKFNQVVKFSKL